MFDTWTMLRNWVHRGGPWTGSKEVVHGPGPKGWSMDLGSMFCIRPRALVNALSVVKSTMAHKGHAANKKRSLQTKKMCCRQKTIAANKKDALQTKNAVAIWPVAVNVFKILNGRQSSIFNKFHQSINPS